MSFAVILFQLRASRRISQDTLAERADIGRTLVSRYECGTRMPKRKTVALLAAALQLTPEDEDALFAAAGFTSPRLRRQVLNAYWAGVILPLGDGVLTEDVA